MHHRLARLISCALLAGASSVAVAASSDSGWYVGAGLGSAKNKLDGLYKDLSQKSNSAAYKLYGGYQFSPNFSTELQYMHLGSWRGEDSDGLASVRTSALAMSVIGAMPLSQQFSLFGKLGVAAKFSNLKDEEHDGRYKYSRKAMNGTYLLGAGAQWQFTPSMALRAEYEYLGRTPVGENRVKMNNSLVSLGLQYKF